MVKFLLTAIVAAVSAVKPALAQSANQETVHAAVVYTRHGDRTPLMLPGYSKLTELGARQLHEAGSMFRERYVDVSSSSQSANSSTARIVGISRNAIDNSELYIQASQEEYVVNSAQAFMQGLYPPLNGPYVDNDARLANGTLSEAPLGNYQYPQIRALSILDPNIVWSAGHQNCPAYSISGADYITEPEFQSLNKSKQAFYNGFASELLNGRFPRSLIGYFNAYDIYDYVSYGYTHNETVNDRLSDTGLEQLRQLADRHEFAVNGMNAAGSVSPSNKIRAIAGSTLAAQVVNLLESNINTRGESEKLNVMFGSHEAFVAFFALARLPSQSPDFYGLPQFGSSIVFELFTRADNGGNQYPKESDLWVRFLARNGTDDELQAYSLFQRGHSESAISWLDFKAEMNSIMTPTVRNWCDDCGSTLPFCAFYGTDSSIWGNSTVLGSQQNGGSGGMTAQVAGVIGAAVTLGVIMIAVAGAMLFGGLRFNRSSRRRRSELGGFKGGEKLASDADLTSGRIGAAGDLRGHERVGSWELEGQKAGQERFGTLKRPESAHRGDDDRDGLDVNPFGDPVRPDERI
ncbi:MAG: hypothetical protein M1833_000939 [Piccolia ochrophora]|nr:MAG: hypothetical protein M1833_000939 [Piccolia ochrophora]